MSAKVIVAVDKFKGSLTGAAARRAVSETLAGAGLESVGFPLADGGEGTLDAVEEFGFESVPVVVPGPTGEPVSTRYARSGSTSVVELADACGMMRLPGGKLAPLDSSTVGLGRVMATALADPSTESLVVGLGGSASTDGGAGLLAGLGAKLLDKNGCLVTPGARSLGAIEAIDLAPVREVLAGREIVLACDVSNPLLGPEGAVSVYGPQKGLLADAARRVEHNMSHWADVLAAACGQDCRDQPGAGAAGGTGFAALSALGARTLPGVALILELGRFGELLAGASLIVTGAGCIDRQDLMGKAVAGVCAAAQGVPVVAVCGQCTLTQPQLAELGLSAVYPLAGLATTPAEAMRNADSLLRRATRQLVQAWF
ncbi:MAG: glycerate kinase [Bifidobacteriaceae bacterium]|nr:glycerate kinase [Bifidobacteriaceae bacterium]